MEAARFSVAGRGDTEDRRRLARALVDGVTLALEERVAAVP